MNAAELARLLGVHVDTIRRKIRSGEIEARQGDGRSYEIPEAEVRRLMMESNYEKHVRQLDSATQHLLKELDSIIEAEILMLESEARFFVNHETVHGLDLESFEQRRKNFEDDSSHLSEITRIIDNLNDYKIAQRVLKKLNDRTKDALRVNYEKRLGGEEDE